MAQIHNRINVLYNLTMEWYAKHPEQTGARFLTPDEVSTMRFNAAYNALCDADVPSVWVKPIIEDCMAHSGLEADRIAFLLLADKLGFNKFIERWRNNIGRSDKGAVVFRLHQDLDRRHKWRIRRAPQKDVWLYSYHEAYYFPLCFDDFMNGGSNA